MRGIIGSSLLLLFLLIGVVGCNTQNEEAKLQLLSATNENEELKSQNVELTVQIERLNSQLNEQNLLNNELSERIEQLENEQQALTSNEHEIKYDLRIPLDVFEVVQNYFYAVNNKDVKMLQAITTPNIYESKVEYFNSLNYKELFIDELGFEYEDTYQGDKKTTIAMVVRVMYNDSDNHFVLVNTNNKGWKITDID